MPSSRRAFLRIAGSSAVILAAGGGGLGAFVLTRTPERALAPWRLNFYLCLSREPEDSEEVTL